MSDISDGGNDSPTERTAIKRSVQQTAPPLRSRWFQGKRQDIAFLAHLGFCSLFLLRVNFSYTITAITSNETVTDCNRTVTTPAKFNWNSEIQGVILSSFFYGYILTHIPGGYLSAIYGGKNLFGIGVALSSICAFLTAIFIEYSLYLLVMARVLKGLFEGVTYPAIHAFWLRWAPPLERSKLMMISISGAYLGIVLSLPTSDYLKNEWTYNFYISGLIAYLVSVVWFYSIKSKPEDEPKISHHEVNYIRSSLGTKYPFVKMTFPVPWKKIFLSYPVWAIIVAHFSENWGFYTLLNELPTFMKDVYGFEHHNSGLLLIAPYLVKYLCVLFSGYAADSLRSKGLLSTVRVRKLFNCTGFLLQTVFLLMAAHTTSPIVLAISLTIAMGLGGIAWCGFGVNHLDIAPPYASILMGISGTFATLPGIISPLVTRSVVQGKSHEEWQIVFHITSVIYLIGAILYGLFASGEEQHWAQLDLDSLGDDDSSKNDNVPFAEVICE